MFHWILSFFNTSLLHASKIHLDITNCVTNKNLNSSHRSIVLFFFSNTISSNTFLAILFIPTEHFLVHHEQNKYWYKYWSLYIILSSYTNKSWMLENFSLFLSWKAFFTANIVVLNSCFRSCIADKLIITVTKLKGRYPNYVPQIKYH